MAEHTPKTDAAPSKAVYVWDSPLRLFHWSLLAAVATSLISVELGNMSVHLISGHVVLGLLVFRLVWGVVGGRHARFSSFVKGPAAVLRYARKLRSGDTPAHLGHNPIGALSVIAMIGFLVLQAGTGLFANDDILTEGPLASTVSKSTSDTLTYIHHLSSNAVYVLIALHLAAVTLYTVKGHRIIAAMITGRTTDIDPADAEVSESDARGSLTTAIVIASVAAGIAYAIMKY